MIYIVAHYKRDMKLSRSIVKNLWNKIVIRFNEIRVRRLFNSREYSRGLL